MPRLTFVQPALPAYRVDFFNRLAAHYGEEFTLYYAPTDMGALTQSAKRHVWERPTGPMQPLFPGTEWQQGTMDIPISAGDTVIVCGGPRTISTLALLAKARLKGARTIWFGHYWSSTSKPWRFYLRMLLMKLAHGVLFYTDREIDEYRAGFGKSDQRFISAANNGINVDPIKAVRAPYSAADRPRDMLIIGRVLEKNRIDQIVEALTDPRLQGVRLQIIGDGPMRPALEHLARERGVADALVWHGGTVDEQAIAAVANQCRMFIFPGAVGLSLIHAMAYGLPALINDDRWGSGPEITAFQERVTGRSFALGDTTDLAEKILLMIDDVTSLDQWSAEARGRADDSYNTQGMTTRVIGLVDDLSSTERG